MKLTCIAATLVFVSSAAITSTASALPSLQLGPDCDPGTTASCDSWIYVDGGDDTWYYSGTDPLTLNAYANATGEDGGNGDYAWATEPDPDQYAYLVASALPDLGDIGDIFDLSISGATLVASGYGSPPVEDPNSLASHDIFDTYFEVYEFQFDGPLVEIENTQPPGGDPGMGYLESFTISWTDLTAGGDITGIHFDLFTVSSGQYLPGGLDDGKLVQAFAPYSHDAQGTPGTPPPPPPPSGVPEPGILTLFTAGIFGMGVIRRRRKKN